jgi:hypothetical protein
MAVMPAIVKKEADELAFLEAEEFSGTPYSWTARVDPADRVRSARIP